MTITDWLLIRIVLVVAFGPTILGGSEDLQMILLLLYECSLNGGDNQRWWGNSYLLLETLTPKFRCLGASTHAQVQALVPFCSKVVGRVNKKSGSRNSSRSLGHKPLCPHPCLHLCPSFTQWLHYLTFFNILSPTDTYTLAIH